MGHDDHQLVLGDLTEKLGDAPCRYTVQISCRFVCNYDIRIFRQCSGYGYSLFLSARQLGNLSTGMRRKSHTIDYRRHTFLYLIGAEAFYHQYQFDVLIHCIAVYQIKILKYVPDIFFSVFFKVRLGIMTCFYAVYIHFPFFIGIKAGYDIEQRGFAAS